MKQINFSSVFRKTGRVLPAIILAIIAVVIIGDQWQIFASAKFLNLPDLSNEQPLDLIKNSDNSSKRATSLMLLSKNLLLANSGKLFTDNLPADAASPVIIRHGFNLNGRIEGSVQQLSGENTIFNSSAVMTGDLLVPGSPNLVRNGTSTFGGTVVGGGNAQPGNYSIILNSGSQLGRLLTRTDPVSMPTVAAPPAPTGTRNVTINNSTQSIGDFATLKNLTLNGNVGNKAIPSGTYGSFTANSGSGFILGTAGNSQPENYNFSSLTLNGGSQIAIAGPVTITLKNGITINGSVGSSGNPMWLELKIATGGVTLNSGSALYGRVVAPTGTVSINSQLIGNVIADRLNINSGGLLRIIQQQPVDTTPPVLNVQQPIEGLVTNTAQITVSGTYSDESPTTITVNGNPATINGNNFTATLPLTEGANILTVSAIDAAGNITDVVRNVTLDSGSPTLEIQQPENYSATNLSQIQVVGTFNDATATTITINDQPANLTGNQFSATVQLANEGENTLIIRAVDSTGNQSQLTQYITRDTTAPILDIASPTNNQTTDQTVISIFGEVRDSTRVSVTVNDIPISAAGNIITSQFEVPEGTTELRIKATDLVGNQTEVVRTVIADATEPVITDITPVEGTIIDGTTVTVQGNVTDATIVTVKVGNISASVNSSGQFTALNVPIAEGENQLLIKAIDAVGNSSNAELALVGKDLTPPSVPVIFPITPQTRLNIQTIEGRAEPGTKIKVAGGTEPVLTDAANGSGLFFANVPLINGQNNFVLTVSDAEGNVSLPAIIGINYDPNLPFPSAGQPSNINISTGDGQRGLINQQLPRPIVAIVSDKDGNPVSGVTVRFNVVEGSGKFLNNTQIIESVSDSSGYAGVNYVSGGQPGIQLIRANFDGNTYTPTTFAVEALSANQDDPTIATGVVRDQNLRALPNVLVRLGGQQTRTGTDGRFRLQNVSSGPHQVLELIGRDQIPFPGRWANISYDMDILPNIDNNLGKPLFLPKVNEGIQLPLNENNIVTQDTSVQIYVKGGEPPIKITARAGTRVIFPPDVTDKRLSVTQIPLNRVPMPLEDGRATNLYISVQPAGAVFETPLEVSFPNLDRLPPDSTTLLMSFDHDAGRYVQVGTGKVTADGRSVVSNPGSGISVGAWHAAPPPDPQPEVTLLGQIQVAGNDSASSNIAFNGQNSNSLNTNSSASLEGKHIDDIIAQAAGVRAVVLTERSMWHQSDKIGLRVRYPAPPTPVETQIDAEVQTSDAKITLLEVSFNGGYDLRSDDGTTKYENPQWLPASSTEPERKYPLAFKAGSAMKIEAKFKPDIEIVPPIKLIKVKSDGNGLYDIATADAKYDKGKNIFKMSSTAVGTPFAADIIDYIENFQINWQTMREGKDWEDAGTSTNSQVYITLASPNLKAHSVVHLATKNLKGLNKSNQDSIFSALWNEFSDRSIYLVTDTGETTKMVYWGSFCQGTNSAGTAPSVCYTPDSIMKKGEGTCESWQEFFAEVAKTQNIRVTKISVDPKDYATFNRSGIVVKGNPSQGRPPFATPAPVRFNNHAIIKFNGKFYDPSYGTGPFNEIKDWENASLIEVFYCSNATGACNQRVDANEADREETVATILP